MDIALIGIGSVEKGVTRVFCRKRFGKTKF